MADIVKVIKGLQCCDDTSEDTLLCEKCPYREDETCSAVAKLHKDALDLITEFELTVPKFKVSKLTMLLGEECAMTTAYCGNCGELIEQPTDDGHGWNYCPHCGMRVLWHG